MLKTKLAAWPTAKGQSYYLSVEKHYTLRDFKHILRSVNKQQQQHHQSQTLLGYWLFDMGN